MIEFVKQHKLGFGLAIVALAILSTLVIVVWPDALVSVLGRKKTFVTTLLNGLTLAGLYFLVASGFTLVFGLMRNVNLAHGSMYLFGGYIGYELADKTGYWIVGVVGAFIAVAIIGAILQLSVFRKMEGDDLRQTLVTIGISVVAADLMLAYWSGTTYQFTPPEWTFGALKLPIVTAIKSSGQAVMLKYPVFRILVLVVAIVVGVLLWLMLNKTKLGMIIRAGVDDREILSASGINIHKIFVLVFAIGAGLAGLAGVIGGTALSISPGEDLRYLLASLVVVIVGGMGSISGAAIGALLIGLAEQFGLAYFPTYGVVLTFLIMIVVLCFKPRGIMGKA